MTKGGYARRLWVELVVVIIAAGAYLYLRPAAGGPSNAQATPGLLPATFGDGPPIVIGVEVFEAPFAGQKDEEISAVLGAAESGQARVVKAEEMGLLRAGLRALAESGRISSRSSGRTSLKPGQPATVRVNGRVGRPGRGAPAAASDELSLGFIGTWSKAAAVHTEAWFRTERVAGIFSTLAAGQPSGGRPVVPPGDAIVLSHVLDDSRYIVILQIEKPPPK